MKNIIKLLVTVLLFAVTILCVGCVSAEFDGVSETSFLGAGIKNGGGLEMEVAVSKEKLSAFYSVTDFEQFKSFFNDYISVINNNSDDVDVLKIKSFAETEDSYRVNISTRRLDTIGLGTLDYRTGATYAAFTGEMDTLEFYYDGINDKIPHLVYPRTSEKTQITYTIRPAQNSVNIKAKKYSKGVTNEVTFQDFKKYLSDTQDKIVTFKMANLVFADSILIRLNGNIRYVSSQGIEVLDENTVKLTPIHLTANDGTENTQIKAFIGYFTYKANLSPLAIGSIVTVGTLFLVFVVLCVRFKWISRFFKGKVFAGMKKYKMLYVMLIPGLILLILFHYLPLRGLVTAFQKYDIYDGYASEYIGLKNFSNIFYAATSDKMYRIFRNTIFISLIRIVTNFPLILVMALVVQSIKRRRVKGMFQGISFIPYFISWTAVSGMAYALLSTNTGLINNVLERLGLERVQWYNNPDPWWLILAVTSLWKGMGWGTLIYIAAMCNIDTELYEACALDGGGILRQAFSVTLPSIMSVICLQLILDVGNIMKDNYEQILALIPGDTSSVNSTVEVIGKYTLSQMNTSGMGSATAMGFIQSLIGLILVLFVNRIVKKTDNEGIL